MKWTRILPTAVLLSFAAGCADAAPYDERMAFLDEMSVKGIEYRQQLQAQATVPDEAACTIGWGLLKPAIPLDRWDTSPTPQWIAQVKEAYVKSCMTGEPIPKPDVSGIPARTPVPFGSERSRSPLPATPS